MRYRTAALSLLVLLSACAPAPPAALESARFPGVVIECGGDPILTREQCLAWAESMLDAPQPEPLDAAAIGRLVLTNRPGNSRCAADFYHHGGRLLMTAAAVCPFR